MTAAIISILCDGGNEKNSINVMCNKQILMKAWRKQWRNDINV